MRYHQKIAAGLTEIALGGQWLESSLRNAMALPGLTQKETSLLGRWIAGDMAQMDHVALQDLAIRIGRMGDAQEKAIGETFWLKHLGSWFAFAEPAVVQYEDKKTRFISKLDGRVIHSIGQNIYGASEPFDDILKLRQVDFPVDYRGYRIYVHLNSKDFQNPVSGNTWSASRETGSYSVVGQGSSAAKHYLSIGKAKEEIDYLIKFPRPAYWKGDVRPGANVYWQYPNGGLGPGYFRVAKIKTQSGKIEGDESVVLLDVEKDVPARALAGDLYLEKPVPRRRPAI